MIKTKSVWSKKSPNDGLRILVTRFRGRGLPKSACDVWMPSLAPSESLLRKGQNSDISWSEFSRLFKMELFVDGPIDRKCTLIKNHGQKFTLRLIKKLAKKTTVTLLCHCADDQKHCHRHVLKKVIESNKI